MPSGECPFTEFLDDLQDEQLVDRIHAQMDYVLQVGVVVAAQKRKVEQLTDDIWEIRVAYQRCIYRVLYARHGSSLVVLLGFRKTTQKTPREHIRLADTRLKDWRARVPPS